MKRVLRTEPGGAASLFVIAGQRREGHPGRVQRAVAGAGKSDERHGAHRRIFALTVILRLQWARAQIQG